MAGGDTGWWAGTRGGRLGHGVGHWVADWDTGWSEGTRGGRLGHGVPGWDTGWPAGTRGGRLGHGVVGWDTGWPGEGGRKGHRVVREDTNYNVIGWDTEILFWWQPFHWLSALWRLGSDASSPFPDSCRRK